MEQAQHPRSRQSRVTIYAALVNIFCLGLSAAALRHGWPSSEAPPLARYIQICLFALTGHVILGTLSLVNRLWISGTRNISLGEWIWAFLGVHVMVMIGFSLLSLNWNAHWAEGFGVWLSILETCLSVIGILLTLAIPIIVIIVIATIVGNREAEFRATAACWISLIYSICFLLYLGAAFCCNAGML